MDEESLYDRLGGVFAIAAVVEHFSDSIIRNPRVGRDSGNPQLAAELSRSLDAFNVPAGEKDPVLAAFAAHKDEVIQGSKANAAS